VRAVVDAVNEARMTPGDMGYFAARDGEPADYCRRRVREADVYVGVIGFRYGSLVPGEDVSYTEREFLEATEAGKPRLLFLLDEAAHVRRNIVDRDSTRIDNFRHRVQQAGLISATFSDADGLHAKVVRALTLLASELGGSAGSPPVPVAGLSFEVLVGPYLGACQGAVPAS
jgi:hypothetical protein